MNTHALIARAKPEAGQALLAAVVILLALTIMGFALLLVTKVELNISRNFQVAEEALTAAEVGANMCAQVANARNINMSFGDTVRLASSNVEAAVRYPRWSCLATKEGLAPSRGGISMESADTQVSYYQFRIQSRGEGRAQSVRTVETIIRVRLVVHQGQPGFSRIAYRY